MAWRSVTYVRRLEPGKDARWEISAARGEDGLPVYAANVQSIARLSGFGKPDHSEVSGGGMNLLTAIGGKRRITGSTTGTIGRTVGAGALGFPVCPLVMLTN